ncbi:MAG TPA: isoprenylcysteine carboxylmethyltransferase family protein, partial [Longilinea sp.]|nr:isoprenylcysteine carboxylmethyltransferase family protein [Longilinea sp.]
LPHHKDLVAERSQINKNTKPWDRVIALGATIPGLILLIVAGLDARFGWSIGLSIPWKIAGFLLIALGDTAFAWSMVYNAYFAVTVRIQEERGHQVATGGPYRIVRHPAYLGMLFNTAGMLLLFSNVWAIIPAAVMVFFLILRTALEDKTLQAELPGYLEFTRQTRYRLIPGIW